MSRYCKHGSIADLCGHDDCNPPSRPLPSSAVVLPYATPPGDTLRETLKSKGISQTLLAETMGRPIKTINEIIHAKARITEQTAIQLEHALNIPAHFWMALETNYRIAVARQNSQFNQQ
jgi:addiction module HigA family antidote